MVKFCGHYIACQEVPDEISLVFSISNCPYRCLGCHSPWLQSDIGDELTKADIQYYVNQYKDGITCVCFMGTGGDYAKIADFVDYVKEVCKLKTCVYTGDDEPRFLENSSPDYFKYGSYDPFVGGLDCSTTNQHMLKLIGNTYVDITEWFWRKKE